MTRKTALILASIVALVHLLLACYYASITPYRTPGILLGQRGPDGGPAKIPDVGAPDERQHANYVLHLLDGKGFPVLDPKDPNLGENYQSHQPPLFYLLEAGWTKITSADIESSSDGLKVRSLNALIGAVTVVGVFFVGLWGFKREDVGVIAATFAALLPMNCALSGSLSNDPLLYCLVTWTLAFCAKGIREGWDLKLAIATGVATGLAIITKTTAVALLPALLLAAYLSNPRPNAKTILAVFAPTVVVALPWLLRNKSLYGDFFGMRAFNEAFVNSPQASTFIDGFGAFSYWTDWVGWWTARSFFGAFGYMDIFLNERGTPATGPQAPNALYRVLIALMVLAFISWLVRLKADEWKSSRSVQVLLGAFTAIVLVLFALFNMRYFQGQARYVFPAIAPIGIGVAMGILNVAQKKWRVGWGVLTAILLALNIFALSRLPGEFQRRTGLLSQRIFESEPVLIPSFSASNCRDLPGV